jgi:CheY-like chemotaxis protein/HPt (histidine-containing phosphotransfer) domain-containing protein
MMKVLLAREGYQVDLASNGLEAFDAIKFQHYDVVFMDLQMPVMDGIEASRRIREWENGGKHTFIVALTASYLPEEGHILFEAGIDNYISKPFELEHIQRLLKYSLTPHVPIAKQPAIPAQETSKEVLDIQKGIDQVGGDLETYKELLGDFINGLPERLQVMQHSFAKMDWAGLSRAAHNLHGIAASLGALQLSEYARKLDSQSIDGYTEPMDDLLREIQLIGSKLLETSNNFLADKKINAGSL